MLMDIEWFPIKGYEGLYEWSPTLEAVRGLKRGKILPWRYTSAGRPYVTLCKNGVTRWFSKYMFIYSHAHQVEIPRGMDVHHIDFNHYNNDPSNLQLLSHEEHMKLHGKTNKCCQKNNYRSKAVVAVDEQNRIVHRFASTREAERHGFKNNHVSAACRGCYSTHRGHYYKGLWWYFEDEWLAMQHKPLIKQD